ncbi:SDR family oxidoreductase [Pelomonas sp. SE-A7]|uniref:SDR family oxidoreductase n=1 Tax=Pelomonas sp. SE-A7 TaxID=3054953 RepID=UPI00259D0C81|nr:SDR family oxidoreductase [Pelomonas sp. SE-A7]MDM4767800.1 SDR family oxidoreductase [Pelomonas sp. SE-A7]
MMQVLVIGASRGIGLEFVRQYRQAGAQVVATARSEDGLAELHKLGAKALKLDVADTASSSGLAWQIDGHQFDRVILNAGIHGTRTTGLQTPPQDEFDAVMRTNVLGPMRVLPQLVDSMAPGARLAILSSRMGSMGLRSASSSWLYRASKAAVNSVLRDASLVFAGRVVCVAFHPGWVRTDMGGSGADLSVDESVAGMREQLSKLTAADNGAFLNYDGQPLAW